MKRCMGVAHIRGSPWREGSRIIRQVMFVGETATVIYKKTAEACPIAVYMMSAGIRWSQRPKGCSRMTGPLGCHTVEDPPLLLAVYAAKLACDPQYMCDAVDQISKFDFVTLKLYSGFSWVSDPFQFTL